MDIEDARTIDVRLRRIRRARGKSLRVVAGLVGTSKSQLDRIERGEVALDRLSEIVALADVLQISPSELMRLPVPAPANGNTDSTIEAVRRVLEAVDQDLPGGLVLPVDVLADRVDQLYGGMPISSGRCWSTRPDPRLAHLDHRRSGPQHVAAADGHGSCAPDAHVVA